MLGDWYEIWVDDGPSLPYVLIVTPDIESDGAFVVIDISRDYKIIYRECDYESISNLLLEDEYYMVRGRMIRDK